MRGKSFALLTVLVALGCGASENEQIVVRFPALPEQADSVYTLLLDREDVLAVDKSNAGPGLRLAVNLGPFIEAQKSAREPQWWISSHLKRKRIEIYLSSRELIPRKLYRLYAGKQKYTKKNSQIKSLRKRVEETCRYDKDGNKTNKDCQGVREYLSLIHI